MFELAVANSPLKTPVVLNTVLVPNQERRYCPVFITRGRPTQYLEHHETPTPALVAKNCLFKLHSDQLSVTCDWSALRRVDRNVDVGVIPQFEEKEDFLSLLDYITDVIPEFNPEHINDVVAFHDVTERELSTCHHTEGMVLVWNDDFVSKNHPARRHCGEGPFKVVRDESYLIAFKMDLKGYSEKCKGLGNSSHLTGIKSGSNRLVLESVTTHNTMIAHGGFFTEVEAD